MEKSVFKGSYMRLRRTEDGRFHLLTINEKARKAADRFSATPVTFAGDGLSGSVVILGAGVAGLTLAYELLKLKGRFKVTVIEASHRTGGRSLTLRPGDSFTEEVPTPKGPVKVTQTCTFTSEGKVTPYPPYLNAGPGRIPSQHRDLLDLCKELGVDLEVYVMESRSNHFFRKGAFGNAFTLNRRIFNDANGYIAIDLYNRILAEPEPTDPKARAERENYLSLLRNFGALTTDSQTGKVVYDGSQRIGYTVQPGITPGIEEKPLGKDKLISSQYWLHRFYQPEDFEWQPTSFQPVGGMDKIEQALADKVRKMGGEILLNAPVTKVERTDKGFKVTYATKGGPKTLSAMFCISNIPIPLMNGMLDPKDFHTPFWDTFTKVATTPGFLQPTCKVGWQAERRLWQDPEDRQVVPIFGGISYTAHPMTQMWYPSSGIHDRYGTLTGTYNYDKNATDWGKLMPEERLKLAREGAAQLHSQEFADGLGHGLSIAWQNIPTQRGGWVEWQNVSGNNLQVAGMMNILRKGERGFHIIGDQLSYLPGWQEGAVVSALEVYAMVTGVELFELPMYQVAPHTARLVQGHVY